MSRYVARTLDEAARLIRERRPFRLRGPGQPTLWATCDPPDYLGYLPPRYSAGIECADYVVMSYNTPIAWETDGEITIPDVGYSPSTGAHQYLAAGAFDVRWRPGRNRDTVRVLLNAVTPWGSNTRARRGGIDGVRPGDGMGLRDDEPEPVYANGTLPEPAEYDYPVTDRMVWRPSDFKEQDDLMSEVHGWSRKHP